MSITNLFIKNPFLNASFSFCPIAPEGSENSKGKNQYTKYEL
jgi:hypothetical protein